MARSLAELAHASGNCRARPHGWGVGGTHDEAERIARVSLSEGQPKKDSVLKAPQKEEVMVSSWEQLTTKLNIEP
jgi:hypothetical protein